MPRHLSVSTKGSRVVFGVLRLKGVEWDIETGSSLVFVISPCKLYKKGLESSCSPKLISQASHLSVWKLLGNLDVDHPQKLRLALVN